MNSANNARILWGFFKENVHIVIVSFWIFRQNGFSVITADRIYSFTVENPDEVHQWVDGLSLLFFLSILWPC